MAPSAKSLAMPPAPTHCACSNKRTPPQHGGGAALLRYPDRLGWLQFKPVRGVVSDAEAERG
jgi:hypothetical protein